MKLSTVFNFIIFLIFINAATYGQANLQKNISLEVNRQRLDNVLEILSNKGDFYFSYNSSIIKKDSLVSFRASNKTVKEIHVKLEGDEHDATIPFTGQMLQIVLVDMIL